MKNIKNYKDFIESKINEEEGWKDALVGTAIAAGSLLPGQLSAEPKAPTEISYEKPSEKQIDAIDWPWSKKTKVVTKKVSTEEESERLQKRGYSLDSVTVDTLWNEVIVQKPDTTIHTTEIKYNDNQFFASGVYSISPEMADSLSETIGFIIENNGIILGVNIESSTDRQGLSINLQNKLKSEGYEPNNKGLSKARCESISRYLSNNEGIDSTIISSEQKFEQGQEINDPNARYVIVKIVYMEKSVISTPEIIEKVPQLNKKFYLSKEVEIKKTHKKRHPHIKKRYKKHKIKHCKNITKCFEF